MLTLKQFFKIQFLKKKFSFMLFIILLSFLVGNIFGLISPNLLVQPTPIIFFLFSFIIEFINIITNFLKNKNSNYYIIFISIRRGFLLGIFIEAFKLGS
jgi:hypothetical protein